METTTVLIVDDDPAVVQTVQAMLRHAGLAVLTAPSGEQALRVMAAAPREIDLVLSDVRMPGMDGPQFLERVRRMSPATGVMMMSGYTELPKQDPDVPFISKPFRFITLLTAIQEIGSGSGETARWKEIARKLTGVATGPSETPLAGLPATDVVKYKNGQTIYGPQQPTNAIYLILDGRVKINRLAGKDVQVLLDIYPADHIFGEAALLDGAHPSEQAIAMGTTRLRSWTVPEVEQAILQHPQLGVEMLRAMAQHKADLARRVEGLALATMERRLELALLHFAERLGTADASRSVHIISFPHFLLSQFVGTSREVITKFMNQFRRQGYIQYSRDGITVHPQAFRDWSGSRST